MTRCSKPELNHTTFAPNSTICTDFGRKSVKGLFQRSSRDEDDPGSLESIERASEKSSRKKQRPPSLRDIPRLTRELTMQNSKSTSLREAQEKAIQAAKTLYELCDVGHKANREPMVASGQYDVIGPLTQCLLHEPIYFHEAYNGNSITSASASASASNVSVDPLSLSEETGGTSAAPEVSAEVPQQPEIKDDAADGESVETDAADNKTTGGDSEGENNHIDSTQDEVSKPITPTGDEQTAAPIPTAAPADAEDRLSSPNPQSCSDSISTVNQKQQKRKKQPRVDHKLHFVCLTLNNLSIPHDNKRVMVMERGAKRLIENLCKVIASGKKEAHLCCIVLMNLSFYEPALAVIGQFSPPRRLNIAQAPPKPEPVSPAASNAEGNGQSNNSGSGPNKAAKAGKKALATTTTVLKRAAAAVSSKPQKLTPLENPRSLLRILQDLVCSAERETSDFRWAFGLLANLSRYPENALLIGLTGIPRVAVDNLRKAKTPSSQWATNSLEDFSLYFLLHLAEVCPPSSLKGALEVATKIMNNSDDHYIRSYTDGSVQEESKDASDGNNNRNHNGNHELAHGSNHRSGIQNLKATMICAFLGLDWKEFPDHGVIAAGAVSELMANTFERVGKKATYTDSDFLLRTAVSAYAALAKAAAKADYSEAASNLQTSESKINKNTLTPATAAAAAKDPAPAKANGSSPSSSSSGSSCVHTKVMALPTSVCLLFKIINAIALHWGEDNNKNSGGSSHGSSHGTGGGELPSSYSETYHWDIKAGDLAVAAVMSLLPALLEGTGDGKPSMGTQQACADLSKMFVFFSKKTNSIAVRARSLEVAEKFTESASGSALPLLEASYDLCRNYGIHRLQKNFL